MRCRTHHAAPPCHEVLITPATLTVWVCEATAFIEHAHADLMPYMRRMTAGERIGRDEHDCLFLDEEGT